MKIVVMGNCNREFGIVNLLAELVVVTVVKSYVIMFNQQRL